MEEDFIEQDLDKLIIKDKKYYYKKKKKLLLIIFVILIIIAIIVTLSIIIKQIVEDNAKYKGGQIICVYETLNDNENILLINIKDDIQYELIVDEIKYDKNNYHTFEKSGLHNVIFHFKNKLDNMEGLFKNVKNIIEIDFSKLETENIKSMEYLFANSTNLKKVNLDINIPNLENINYMFSNCSSLKILNLDFDISKITEMKYLFFGCKELTYLDITNFSLENIANMEYMFTNCYKLKEIKFNN